MSTATVRGLHAKETQVTPEKSRIEIEMMLKKYGATGFAYGWEHDYYQLAFRSREGVPFRLRIRAPRREDFLYRATGRMPEHQIDGALAKLDSGAT